MTYPYDVALSFAEEDRNIALALALALELRGQKKVYYYPLHYEATWGTELEARLREIYTREARYAVVLLSDDYFRKRFTAIEHAAIRDRAAAEAGTVYLLPVLLQDPDSAALREYSNTGYLRWD